MKTNFRLSLARLTEMFGESNRPARVQKSFNAASGHAVAASRAYMAMRYRPLNCPMFSFQ